MWICSRGFIIAVVLSCIVNTFAMSINFHIDHNDSNNLHCYCTKEHYTTAKIINRSIWYSLNNSKMEPFTSNKLNRTQENENINVKGDVTLTYNLFNNCYYICKMPIFYNDKHKHFILDHLDAYYKVGGYLNMMCNSSLCTLGNQLCNLVNIKDEL